MDDLTASFEHVLRLAEHFGSTSYPVGATRRRSTAMLLSNLVTPYISPRNPASSISHDPEPVSAKELDRLLSANLAEEFRGNSAQPVVASLLSKCKTDVYVMSAAGYAFSTVVQSIEQEATHEADSVTLADGVTCTCALSQTSSLSGLAGSVPSSSLAPSVFIDLRIDRTSAWSAPSQASLSSRPHLEANGLHQGRYELHFDMPVHVRVEVFSVPSDGDAGSIDTVLLASSTRALAHMQSRDGLQDDVRLTLAASVPLGSTRVFSRVSFTRLRSVSGEGHTLNVTVPAECHPHMTPSVDVHILFADGHTHGLKSVVSPSHAFQLDRFCASTHSRVRLGPRCSAYQGAQVQTVIEHSAVLLLEPNNSLCTWTGLLSAVQSEKRLKALPAALQRWLELADGVDTTPSLLRWQRMEGLVSYNDRSRGSSISPLTASSAPPVIDTNKLPRHIAIVMDGNGRWAKQRGLGRSEGHRAGVQAIHAVIRSCRRHRIAFLTLYAFSAQNWSRPAAEVAILMSLLDEFVRTDLHELVDNGVRLLVQGDVERLPGSARMGLKHMMEASKHNTGLTLVLALSYGGREEIANAASAAAAAVVEGKVSVGDLSDPQLFNTFLQLGNAVPDPDLLIRTSGELRISNFLLWQVAYTELFVTPVLWPDFGDEELACALGEYAKRERRFGKTSEQVAEKQVGPGGSDRSVNAQQADRPSEKGRDRCQTGVPYAMYVRWWWTGLNPWVRCLAAGIALLASAALCAAVVSSDAAHSRRMGLRVMRLPLRWLVRGLPLSHRLPSSHQGTSSSWVQVSNKEDERAREACLLWLDYPMAPAGPHANVSSIAAAQSGGVHVVGPQTVQGHTSCNFSGWTRAGAVADRWETTHPGQHAGAPPLTPRPLASVAPRQGSMAPTRPAHARPPHLLADIPDHMATMTPYSMPTLPGQLSSGRQGFEAGMLDSRALPAGMLGHGQAGGGGPPQERELQEIGPGSGRIDDL